MSASSEEAENVAFDGAAAAAGVVSVVAFPPSSSSSSFEAVEREDARAATARGRGCCWGELKSLLLRRVEVEVSVRVGGTETAAAAVEEEKVEEEEEEELLSLLLVIIAFASLDRSVTAPSLPRGGQSPVERAGSRKVAREGSIACPSIDCSRYSFFSC